MKRQFLILIAIAAFAAALTTNAFGQTWSPTPSSSAQGILTAG